MATKTYKPMEYDMTDGFWIVERPRELSEMDDIFYRATVADIILQSKGGLEVSDVIGVFPLRDEEAARSLASKLLAQARFAKEI